METAKEFLRQVGEWTGDPSVERGVMTAAGVVATAVFATYRWFRGSSKRRSRVLVECEPGESILIQTGKKDEQKKA